MLLQERLIARVRELSLADTRLDAVLTYGSFASGSGDAHSDIEFWLFATEPIDAAVWCAQVAPTLLVVRNEFGADVALFAGLVRGEFHFADVSQIASVGQWPARGAAVDAMVLVDRRGTLRPVLEALPLLPPVPASGVELCGRLANWLVLAHQVAARGELLRAVDALGHGQRHLLWLARLATGSTERWLTPSRLAERDLAPATIAELSSVSCRPEPDSIAAALHAAWQLGRRYWTVLAERAGEPVPAALFAELDRRL